MNPRRPVKTDTEQIQQPNPIPIGMLMPTDDAAHSTKLQQAIEEEIAKINASVHCAERLEAAYRAQEKRQRTA